MGHELEMEGSERHCRVKNKNNGEDRGWLATERGVALRHKQPKNYSNNKNQKYF